MLRRSRRMVFNNGFLWLLLHKKEKLICANHGWCLRSRSILTCNACLRQAHFSSALFIRTSSWNKVHLCKAFFTLETKARLRQGRCKGPVARPSEAGEDTGRRSGTRHWCPILQSTTLRKRYDPKNHHETAAILGHSLYMIIAEHSWSPEIAFNLDHDPWDHWPTGHFSNWRAPEPGLASCLLVIIENKLINRNSTREKKSREWALCRTVLRLTGPSCSCAKEGACRPTACSTRRNVVQNTAVPICLINGLNAQLISVFLFPSQLHRATFQPFSCPKSHCALLLKAHDYDNEGAGILSQKPSTEVDDNKDMHDLCEFGRGRKTFLERSISGHIAKNGQSNFTSRRAHHWQWKN